MNMIQSQHTTKHLMQRSIKKSIYTLNHRHFAVISSSMLRPSCVDISERIAEVTLSKDEQFVKLNDRKRALKLVTASHLGLVSQDVSQLVLNRNANGNVNGKSRYNDHHYTRDQISILRRELEKIDKTDEEYIREPAPNLNMLNPQCMSVCTVQFMLIRNFYKFPGDLI